MPNTKPQVPVINSANSIAKDLVFDWTPTSSDAFRPLDLVHNDIGAVTNTPTAAVRKLDMSVDMGTNATYLWADKNWLTKFNYISFEMIFIRDGPGTNNYGQIWRHSDQTTDIKWIEVYNDNGDGGWGLSFNFQFNNRQRIWSIPYPTNREVTHIIVTFDHSASTNTPLIWKNGVLQTLTDRLDNAQTNTFTANDIQIGSNNDGALFLVRYWSRMLTRNEVRELTIDPWQIYKKNNLSNYLTSPSGNVTTARTIQGLARITASVAQTILGRARITATTLQTILGRSRITASTIRTIQGLSRITATTTRTILGRADILATTTRTIQGLSRIQKAVTQTIQGLSRITASTARTIQGLARITATTTRTITGKADILNTTLQAVLGRGRIQKTVTQTIQGIARLAIAVSQTIQGRARITTTATQTILGRADILKTATQTILGKSAILRTVSQTIQGLSRITKSVAQTILGVARITASTSRTILGKADILKSVSRTILGIAAIVNADTISLQTILGRSRIGIGTNRTIKGKASILSNILPPTQKIILVDGHLALRLSKFLYTSL